MKYTPIIAGEKQPVSQRPYRWVLMVVIALGFFFVTVPECFLLVRSSVAHTGIASLNPKENNKEFWYDWANRLLKFDLKTLQEPLGATEFLDKNFGSTENKDWLESINGGCHLDKIYNIHSHNDYWRDVPLFDAMQRNIKSVEADIWYFPETGSKELFVGHHTYSISKYHTLNRLYLDYLQEILQQSQKLFHNFPNESMNFIIDIKNKNGADVYEVLKEKLMPLSEYLSYFDFEKNVFVEKQLNIIISGNVPIDYLKDENRIMKAKVSGRRHIFIDSNIGTHEEQLKELSIISSISYDDFVKETTGAGSNKVSKVIQARDGQQFLNTSVPKTSKPLATYSNGYFTAGQLKFLKNLTSNCETTQKRIWGVPQHHLKVMIDGKEHSSGSFVYKAYSAFKKLIYNIKLEFQSAESELDVGIWKDLVLNGGINLLNFDDLDFGVQFYDQIVSTRQ